MTIFQMDIKIALGLLSLFSFILYTSTLKITVCDCSKPASIGLLDSELPAYCHSQVEKSTVIKSYTFFVKEEPHAHWDGFMCKTWLKTKKIDGFFFGGFDTVFTTYVRAVTEQECWEMVQYHRCHGNQMRGDTDVFSLTASAEGVKAHGCKVKLMGR
jgi:hypothetical protein